MRIMKWLTLLASMMLLWGVTVAQSDSLSYGLGDTIQDFTFTTYDGETIAFSDVLKEKEAVLINIWATWCGPCKNEFPYMQQAYEEYRDRVEVIALSCERSDTNDVLAAFAKEYGLTFKIGQDPVGFLEALGIGSIPTTMMIDRFGTICLIESGAQPSKEAFERMFDAFLGDDYTESVLYHGVPGFKPNVPSASEVELAAALDAVAVNPTNALTWPMLPAEKDGRQVLASSNAGHASSEAAVTAKLSAKAGDAIVVTFKTSTERIFDLMKIRVNGKLVKVFSGEHDWMDYVIPVVDDGEYDVKVSYVKDQQGEAGADTIWVDSISVEEDAETAILRNPVYPVAEKLTIQVQGTSAREIVMEDATGLLQYTFGDARYFIATAPKAKVHATMTSDCEPESAFFYTNGRIVPLMDSLQDDVYAMEFAIDSADTTGYACTAVMLYLDPMGTEYQAAVVFQDEKNVELLCQHNNLGSWKYAGAAEVNSELSLPSQVEYVFKCVDADGNPVEGVMLQICDESTCQVLITDASGSCTMSAAPYEWEVHILMAPAGYFADQETIIKAPLEGGEVVLQLKKQ